MRMPHLRERDNELAHIDELIADAREGRGGLLFIEAGAGLGKSSLAAEASGRAVSAGLTVLSARGVVMERELGFGAVRQLFRKTLSERSSDQLAALLTGVAGLAGPVLLGDDGTPPSADATFRTYHGLYWLLADLAAQTPLLVVLDDAHWADDPSVEWLSYLASRLDGIAAGALVTARPPEASSPAVLLRASEQMTTRLNLAPLSPEAVAAGLGEPGIRVDQRFAAACHRITGGNPFLLSELAAELDRRQLSPVETNVDVLEDLAPGGVARLVLTRLAALPVQAHKLARVLTVLEDSATVRHAAKLADLDLATATAAAVALANADILEPGRKLSFAHPLLRSAVASTVNDLALAALHARAARILADDNATPEAIAVHLLEAEPSGDEWVVDVLRRAAAAALARGASTNARTFLDRALREPAQPHQRFEVLSDLGQAESLTGNPDAVRHLRAALEVAPDRRAHAVVAMRLGWLLIVRGAMSEGYALLRGVVEDVGCDASQRALASGLVFYASINEPEFAADAPGLLRQARALTVADSRAGKMVTAFQAYREAVTAEGTQSGLTGCIDALEGGYLEPADDTLDPLLMVACAMTYVDAFDQGHAVLTRMLEHASTTGSEFWAGGIWCYCAMLELRRGRYADAVAAGRLALDLYTECHLDARRPHAAGYLMQALLSRGQNDEAAAVLGEIAPAQGPRSSAAVILAARAELRLAQGRAQEAVDDALRAGAEIEALRVTNPAVASWRSTAAQAAFALGDVPRAQGLVGDELALARRSGVASAVGRALRISGRIFPGTAGLTHLREATEVLAPSGARGELARAFIDRGVAEREAGLVCEARAHLQAGLDLASQCEATGLATEAIQELRTTGARPRRQRATGLGALTPSELRAARLAAEGLTNREVAQALFITTKTVEDHLSAAYRKLAIGSRAELRPALSA